MIAIAAREEIGVGRHGPGVKPIRRSGRRPSTYRPLTSKTRCVHRADAIGRMHHAGGGGRRRDVIVEAHGHNVHHVDEVGVEGEGVVM